MLSAAKKIIKETFGYDGFRPLQEEIIQSVLDKKDALVLMPTGGGKSLCYQIPALLFNGMTIVVSPLISLMKDQVDQLALLNIPAAMLNSSLDLEEYYETISLIRNNKIKLLYIAPETLMKPDISGMISSIQVDCLAIDEAHCISEWGHDFRPEYRQLVNFRAKIPSAVCIALTATATERVRNDIVINLNMNGASRFIASFNRENLYYQVVPKKNPFQQILDFLKNFAGSSGIIYCFSRSQVDSLCEKLCSHGYSARPYHAGLPDGERRRNQELFRRDEVQIIIATIAFGMGIHKTNVRFVIHHDLPKSIESYYQETGRAGRDGLPARCLLLYGYSDVGKIKYFIGQKEDDAERRIANLHLKMLIDYAEARSCRRIPLIRYFGEDYTESKCDACDNCTGEFEPEEDATVQAQMFLSCVKRTGERFGINHVIDVLRGSEAKKVIDFGHHTLSTYGIGKQYSKKYWNLLARQFIREGLVIQDLDDYSILKIAGRGYEAMRGTVRVFARTAGITEETHGKSNNSKVDYDPVLFEILRKKRKELADMENMPPYIVFSDKTLAEMAAYFPQSEASMMEIYGIGSVKYEKYGALFLDLIRQHAKEKNIGEKDRASSTNPAASNNDAKTPRHIAIGHEFNDGAAVSGLMKKYQVKLSTILDNLYEYLMNGHALEGGGLDELRLRDKNTEEKIIALFARHGAARLKPVYDALGGTIDYEILKMYRVYYLCRERE
jgi:ATP-dependent DNA helicase RecQ